MIFFCFRLSHFSWINVNKYEKWYFISALCADGTERRREKWRKTCTLASKDYEANKERMKEEGKYKKNMKSVEKLFIFRRTNWFSATTVLWPKIIFCVKLDAWYLFFFFFFVHSEDARIGAVVKTEGRSFFSRHFGDFAFFCFVFVLWFCYVRIAYTKASGLGRSGHS